MHPDLLDANDVATVIVDGRLPLKIIVAKLELLETPFAPTDVTDAGIVRVVNPEHP
jgi:hypothetical protein